MLRAFRVCVLVCLAVAVVTARASAEETIAQIVKKVKPAVVSITTYDASGRELGSGTGFLVDAGHVITNWHVVQGANKVKVKLLGGASYAIIGIAASDETTDLANLALSKPVKNPTVLRVAKKSPEQGDRVIVIGNPLGLDFSVSDGIVSASRDVPGIGHLLQITAPISPGSSGSPVVDMQGIVVGVVRSYLAEGQNLNFAVSSEDVFALKPHAPTPLKGTAIRHVWRDKEYLRALDFYGKDEYAKALPLFQAITERVLDEEAPWIELGVCYGQLGRWTEALDAFRQAIRIEPHSALAHYNEGIAFGELGRPQDALESFKQALGIKSDYADAYSNLGKAYADLGCYTNALEAFKQVIRLKPDDAISYCNVGIIYHCLGRTAEEIDSYKQSIRIKPDYVDAHYDLGMAYAILGNTGSALDEYKILKELDKTLADKLFDLIYK